jgi:4-hydroxy-tetrahydrodipicolinate synthase
MPSARDAREWAEAGSLHGIGNSLYTPFSGRDGDDIDFDAYRTLVRYCTDDLGHEMLWLTSGIAEWWSLTMDERKQLVEVAIDEARRVAPPPMEVHGGEGVLRYFQYVADRTDIALGMFNSPSSGYVLTPEEIARIYEEVPAVCAIKQGVMHYGPSNEMHRLAPSLVIWECDLIAYRAGWLQAGIIGPAQLGTAGYLHETPEKPMYTEYWNLIWEGRLQEAIRHAEESGLDQLGVDMNSWYTKYRGRPDYFTHWGEAFRYAASVVGLPIGDYPHSRPPQAVLPEEAKVDIRKAFENAGLARQPLHV